jgi:hypothetical protein
MSNNWSNSLPTKPKILDLPDRLKLVEILGKALIEKLPWSRLVTKNQPQTLIREIMAKAEACAAAGNSNALGQLVHEWKQTAEIYADPLLASELKRTLSAGSGKSISFSKKKKTR